MRAVHTSAMTQLMAAQRSLQRCENTQQTDRLPNAPSNGFLPSPRCSGTPSRHRKRQSRPVRCAGAARGGAAGREGTASRLRGSAPGRAAAERPALRPPRARATASPHSGERGGAERAAAIAYGARRLLAPRPAVSRERGGARAALERSVLKWWGAEATVTLPALPRAACPQHGALGIPAVRHAVPSGSRARD